MILKRNWKVAKISLLTMDRNSFFIGDIADEFHKILYVQEEKVQNFLFYYFKEYWGQLLETIVHMQAIQEFFQ